MGSLPLRSDDAGVGRSRYRGDTGSPIPGRITYDHYTALSEARSLLVMASSFIRRENGSEAAILDELLDAPVNERKFIDEMVADHCRDRRFDRRKAFFERRWRALCQQYPHAPGLVDRSKLDT